MCLDNPDVRAAAEKFLTALVEHYRHHPALLGYDLWNENTYFGGSPHNMYCYCDATKNKLRQWLRARHGSLEQLGKAWFRYSYQTWDDVEPPTRSPAIPTAWIGCNFASTMRSIYWTGG